jgi:hypothetical protein
LWDKAGQRSLARSPLLEAAEQFTRALARSEPDCPDLIPAGLQQAASRESPSSKFKRVFKSLPSLGRKFQYRRYTIGNQSHTLCFSLFLVVARRSSRDNM